jgi:hypothetical protein
MTAVKIENSPLPDPYQVTGVWAKLRVQKKDIPLSRDAFVCRQRIEISRLT